MCVNLTSLICHPCGFLEKLNLLDDNDDDDDEDGNDGDDVDDGYDGDVYH